MTLTIEYTPTGWLLLYTTVTDGREEWLKTERYMDYSEQEARELYAETLEREGLTVT